MCCEIKALSQALKNKSTLLRLGIDKTYNIPEYGNILSNVRTVLIEFNSCTKAATKEIFSLDMDIKDIKTLRTDKENNYTSFDEILQ